MLLELLRTHIVETARELPVNDLVVLTGGNVSARDKETGAVAITPSGVPYEKMRPDDITVVKIDGEMLDGYLKPSVDLYTHLAIYKARPDIFSVIHTHSTYATILGVLGMRLPDITTTLAYSNGPGGVDIAPYVHVFEPKLAEIVIEKLGNRHAVLLENHGVIACGASIKKCLQIALIVEQAAQIYVVSKTLGEPKILTAQHAYEIHEHYSSKYGQIKI